MYLVQPESDVLVLCAHPDDEIGCGALINRLIETGHTVHYVYFSDCAVSTEALGFAPKMLLDECRQSCAKLGIDLANWRGFNFPVRHFPNHRQEILETLIQLRQEINPSLVLTASRDDIHQDHSTLTNEVVRAFKHSNIVGYEFPWNHIHSHLDMLVRVEQRHIDAKLAAWKCYKTQSVRAYHGDHVLESLARVRGAQAKSEFAESYESIRIFI